MTYSKRPLDKMVSEINIACGARFFPVLSWLAFKKTDEGRSCLVETSLEFY